MEPNEIGSTVVYFLSQGGLSRPYSSSWLLPIVRVTRQSMDQMVSVEQAVLKTIRDRFGGNLKVSFVGGAATSMEVLNFFENIDIKILEGYGLTETSPLVTVNTPEQVSWTPGRRVS